MDTSTKGLGEKAKRDRADEAQMKKVEKSLERMKEDLRAQCPRTFEKVWQGLLRDILNERKQEADGSRGTGREYTTDEVQEQFLNLVRRNVAYWKSQARRGGTLEDALEGLAFSILVLLDGGAMGMPGFIVAPDPHPTDREYHQESGENWFPENHEAKAQIKGDISGSLHELLRREPIPWND